MSGDQWTRVAALDDLEDGVPFGVEIDDEPAILVRRGDEIHACGGKCAHYGAPLENGLVVGAEIVCPWHCARYDLRTGNDTRHPALTGVGCYSVKVEDGDVFVGPKREQEPVPVTDDDDRTFAIVGAGAAGNACAETLRNMRFGGRIVLITAEEGVPFDRPSLSKEFMAGTAKAEWLPLHDEEFYAERRIEMMNGRRVASVDPQAKVIRFEDGEELAFDKALLATGGRPRTLDFPGADLDGVFTLRSLADAERIVEAAEEAEVALVVGAGFIGMEVAAGLCERGLEVHVVAPNDVPLARVFGKRIGGWLQSQQEEKGVAFHMGQTVAELRGEGKVQEAQLSAGETVKADLVVVGVGITPVVDYLQDSGLVEEGAVPVDGRLQTKAEDVFAAGDIAVVPDKRVGKGIRVEHWTVAEMQGRHAAGAMLGRAEDYVTVPFFWTMQAGTSAKYSGFSASTDAVAYHGSVEDGKFVAGFYRDDGQLMALAGAGMSREFIACAELLQRGGNIPSGELADPDADLLGVLDGD